MSRPFTHPPLRLEFFGAIIIGRRRQRVILPARKKMGNWDFDGDEAFFFFIASILGVVGLIKWYGPLAGKTHLGDRGKRRLLLGLAPPAAMAGLLFILTQWADPKYVVGQLDYILLFLAGGLALLALAAWMLRLLGVEVRDDAIER